MLAVFLVVFWLAFFIVELIDLTFTSYRCRSFMSYLLAPVSSLGALLVAIFYIFAVVVSIFVWLLSSIEVIGRKIEDTIEYLGCKGVKPWV